MASFHLRIVEHFEAKGHPNLKATNAATIEVTKESYLTPKGDCIVAVSSTKAAVDLSEEFKKAARNLDAIITLEIEHCGERFFVSGRGAPQLTFMHPHDMVARRSAFLSDRTIMILADKAAKDMPRSMVRSLTNPESVVDVSLQVDV